MRSLLNLTLRLDVAYDPRATTTDQVADTLGVLLMKAASAPGAMAGIGNPQLGYPTPRAAGAENFLCEVTIDSDADSPLAAARETWNLLHAADAAPWVVDVFDREGRRTQVDLANVGAEPAAEELHRGNGKNEPAALDVAPRTRNVPTTATTSRLVRVVVPDRREHPADTGRTALIDAEVAADWCDDLGHAPPTMARRLWACLGRAVTCWCRETTEGREALQASLGKADLSDLAEWLPCDTLEEYLADEGVQNLVVTIVECDGAWELQDSLVDDNTQGE